ncbi:putative pentatricopeptide repeat-containing protein At5g40405 [Amborella trichopoda]|uniref:putative pentatricopeptide repeat-containing protein At5g40405 n=1 Tax=Amborella trichopoda TaxID=13333 RepID=UPI0005D45D6D|nr:putative pentatricopeptide repeat-containing protein At5g40405 [Amborella trichopoda]|eukprot:XP_011621222.1 putative pentatricopeptide repeat-containing protein At5g40405 [Amborella trichopoda]
MANVHQLHAHIIKTGLIYDQFIVGKLIEVTVFSKSGDLGYAHRILTKISEPNTFSFNTLIRAYARASSLERATQLYTQLLCTGLPLVNNYTYTFLLSGCSGPFGLDLGLLIHGHVFKCGAFAEDLCINNALIAMYAVFGYLVHARKVFNRMPQRDLVSWNALLSGYARSSRPKEALRAFREMQREREMPNRVTVTTMLSVCAQLGALELGKWLHVYVNRERIPVDLPLNNALVDMYAKCGCLEGVELVFIEMAHRGQAPDVYTWSSALWGLASLGRGAEALSMFREMRMKGVTPNEATLLAMLSACSHSGLVREGQRLFYAMKEEYGIEPSTEHYGCMVDMLGRAGFLSLAMDVIKSMPIEPTAQVWGALLGACGKHKNIELGELAMGNLKKLEPLNGGYYVILSNVYASHGMWDKVENLRREMRKLGIRKTPGCSSIEVNGFVHEFACEEYVHSKKERDS